MDDLLVLAPTRWTLHQAVTVGNQGLAALGLEQHPDKTFIGRVEHGFAWLGYHLGPGQVTVAPPTLARGAARLHRLDEQQRRKPTLAAALEADVRQLRHVMGRCKTFRHLRLVRPAPAVRSSSHGASVGHATATAKHPDTLAPPLSGAGSRARPLAVAGIYRWRARPMTRP